MKTTLLLAIVIGFTSAHAQIKPIELDLSKQVGKLNCTFQASTIAKSEAGYEDYTDVESIDKDFPIYNYKDQKRQNEANLIGITEPIDTKIGTFTAAVFHNGDGKPTLIQLRSQSDIELLHGAKISAEGGPDFTYAYVGMKTASAHVYCRLIK